MKYITEKKKNKSFLKFLIIIVCAISMLFSCVKGCGKLKAVEGTRTIPANPVLIDVDDYNLNVDEIFLLTLNLNTYGTNFQDTFNDLIYLDNDYVLQYKRSAGAGYDVATFPAVIRLYNTNTNTSDYSIGLNVAGYDYNYSTQASDYMRQKQIETIYFTINQDEHYEWSMYIKINNINYLISAFSHYSDVIYLSPNFVSSDYFYYNLQSYAHTTKNMVDLIDAGGIASELTGNYRTKLYNMLGTSIYNIAYQNGYTNGFNEGFTNGNQAGYNTGYNAGNTAGYTTGYNEGHTVGYDEGYDAGYDYGEERGYSAGYGAGYGEGLDEGYQAGRDEGFDAGLEEGYQNGLNDGMEAEQPEIYQNAFNEGMEKAFSEKGFAGFVSGIFTAIDGFLNIHIGSFTIGGFLVIPLAITVCWAILKLMRGGGE